MEERGWTRVARGLVSIVVLACAVMGTAQNCMADLQDSLVKYRATKIDPKGLERIRRYDHLIRYFCSFSYIVPNRKVDPDFIRALILAESSGIARAKSAKNALGLGQILYPTGVLAAKELAAMDLDFSYVKKKRLARLAPKDLYDPAVNILLTCYLIAKYNVKFAGRLDLVVSAWNAGENTPSLKKGNHAPYAETEDLIGKVNGYFLYLRKND